MTRAKATRDADGLTPLERRFAVHYLESFNATQAYIAASANKVTNKTAEANGYRLLQKPHVQALIKAERDRLMQKAELSVDNTLNRLRQFLNYDVRKLVGPDGRPMKITDLDDDTAAAIIGVKVVTKGNADLGFGEIMELKFVDKVSALEKAMKYHGLFEIDNRQRTDPVTELIKAVYGADSRITPAR